MMCDIRGPSTKGENTQGSLNLSNNPKHVLNNMAATYLSILARYEYVGQKGVGLQYVGQNRAGLNSKNYFSRFTRLP